MNDASAAMPTHPPMTRASASFVGLHVVTIFSSILQLVIDRSYDNLLVNVIILLSSTVTFAYLQRTRALDEVPLSSFALLGLCITTQWGALVGQSLMWTPVAANLRVPVRTFAYLAGFQAVAITAHLVSRRLAVLMAARKMIADHILTPMGLFKIPVPAALWFIGAIGLAATAGAGSDLGAAGSKVAGGFGVLAWAPFTIPALYIRLGPAYCNLKRQLSYLVVYIAAAVLVGAALNARSVMFVGALTGMLLYLLVLLNDKRPFRWQSLKWAAGIAITGAALFQPLTDFALAIQVAREYRGRVSALEMVNETFLAMTNANALRQTRDKFFVDATVGIYDEFYFASPLLARFVETKFHDNSFFLVENVRPLESSLILEDALDRIWAILPYPVLKMMDKEKSKYVLQYSAGDYLSYVRFGSLLGGFKTGSVFAQIIAIFGEWTPVAYFLLCIPIFIFWDSLAKVTAAGPVVSVIGMLVIYRLFAYGIASESLSNFVGQMLRNHLQNVLLYTVLFSISRVVWKPYQADNHSTLASTSNLARFAARPT